MKEVAKMYCTKCGVKLIFNKEKIINYDINTGKPNWVGIFTCPNDGFWSKINGTYHNEEWIFDWIPNKK